MDSSAVIHINPTLAHQVIHGEVFAQGIPGCIATTDLDRAADIHIVSGPHYALNRWRSHERVLMIDRAYWGDPDYISIGWLNNDGSRRFATGKEPRYQPGLFPWRVRAQSALILADYGQDTTEAERFARKTFGHTTVRRHPADKDEPVSLVSQLMLHDVAIGGAGSALVQAAVLGVPCICNNPENPAYPVASRINADLYFGDRWQWLHDLSYRQFNHNEIADGTAWEYLRRVE